MFKKYIILIALLLFSSLALSAPFIDNGDGTVLDVKTNLMWQSSDDDVARLWQEAIDYCSGLEFPVGGYTDWRLPNIKELASINNPSKIFPSVDDAFSGINQQQSGQGDYWSSTTSPPTVNYHAYNPFAYTVNLYTGGQRSAAKGYMPFPVLCVR